MFQKLIDFVNQTRLDEKPSSPPICPYDRCQSFDIDSYKTRTTLLGGEQGIDNNINHTWKSCYCNKCGLSFVRETKYGNVWYTDEYNNVLAGIPNCFENYIYTHKGCDGNVNKNYTQLDGITNVMTLHSSVAEDGSLQDEYRTFYHCDKCTTKIEVNNHEYF